MCPNQIRGPWHQQQSLNKSASAETEESARKLPRVSLHCCSIFKGPQDEDNTQSEQSAQSACWRRLLISACKASSSPDSGILGRLEGLAEHMNNESQGTLSCQAILPLGFLLQLLKLRKQKNDRGYGRRRWQSILRDPAQCCPGLFVYCGGKLCWSINNRSGIMRVRAHFAWFNKLSTSCTVEKQSKIGVGRWIHGCQFSPLLLHGRLQRISYV